MIDGAQSFRAGTPCVYRNGMQRLTDHRRYSEWWPLTGGLDVEHYETREEAAARERTLIAEHLPRFNVQHKRVPARSPGAVGLRARRHAGDRGTARRRLRHSPPLAIHPQDPPATSHGAPLARVAVGRHRRLGSRHRTTQGTSVMLSFEEAARIWAYECVRGEVPGEYATRSGSDPSQLVLTRHGERWLEAHESGPEWYAQ